MNGKKPLDKCECDSQTVNNDELSSLSLCHETEIPSTTEPELKSSETDVVVEL